MSGKDVEEYVASPNEEYKMLERLGKGSFGAVYKAIHIATKKEVAIKKCMSDDMEESRNEMEIMKDCNHENIVKCFDCYIHDGLFWIVMEYCALGSITDVLKIAQPGNPLLKEAQVASLCRSVLEGLAYLHENNKMHRDIKPENILITLDGTAKLADFGVAGTFSTFYQKRTTLTGTPYYIAPEIFEESDQGYDAKADVWSLGICSIEFAQGEPPNYEIQPMKVMLYIAKNPPPKLKNHQNFSEEFNHFIACCLIKDPNKRPTARQMLEHIFVADSQPTQETLRPLIDIAKKEIYDHGGLENAINFWKAKKPSKPPVKEMMNLAITNDVPPPISLPPENLPPPNVEPTKPVSPRPQIVVSRSEESNFREERLYKSSSSYDDSSSQYRPRSESSEQPINFSERMNQLQQDAKNKKYKKPDDKKDKKKRGFGIFKKRSDSATDDETKNKILSTLYENEL